MAEPVAVLAGQAVALARALEHIAALSDCESDFFRKPHCYKVDDDPRTWCDHCIAVVALAAWHLGYDDYQEALDFYREADR